MTLEQAHRYVASEIAWRTDNTLDDIEDFSFKWKLDTKTSYRIIPVSGCDSLYPIIRVGGGRYQLHSPPFHTLPDLECHIASPYAVINAGPKCVGRGLTEIARICHQSAAKAWATRQRKNCERGRGNLTRTRTVQIEGRS